SSRQGRSTTVRFAGHHWHSGTESANGYRQPSCTTGSASVPTYQYRCTECGEPLEAVQAFTDDPLTQCPACGGRLRKVFSAVGVVFKGSGFYRTDSRSAKDGAG